MKKVLAMILCLSLVFALAACGGGASSSAAAPASAAPAASAAESTGDDSTAGGDGVEYPVMTFKLAHDAPLETPHHEACENIKAEVEERSGGNITVEIYPLQQLGSAREMIEGMQMNTIEMVLLPTSKYGGFYPTLNIMDMPFLFPTEESSMKLFQSDLADELMAGLEDIKIHGNAFYPSGFKNFTNNKEIHSPDDFKGQKIRTQEAPIIMTMYETWGATPITIDIMELYNALQQGTVDGQENPYLSIASMKLYEVQKYMIVSKHSYLEYIMCSSQTWWEGLDDNTRALLDEVVDKNQMFCYERLQEYNEEYLATIEAGDIIIYELTEEEREVFRESCAPVYEAFGAEIGEDILQKVQDFLAQPENQSL